MKKQTIRTNIKKVSGITFFLFIVGIIILMLLFNIKLYYLNSSSMEPVLSKGSLLINRKEDFKNIEVNDIVTYKIENSSMYISERVEKIIDENNIEVSSIQNKSIINVDKNKYQSKMLFHIPYLGSLLVFFQNKGKWILIVFILLLTMKVVMDLKKVNKGV